jgi:hypothetical protein
LPVLRGPDEVNPDAIVGQGVTLQLVVRRAKRIGIGRMSPTGSRLTGPTLAGP